MADRAEDPRTAPPIRWGILGAGNIAATFAAAVNAHTRAQLVAVGSRNKDRAERFATAHHIPTTHVGYRELVEDTQVDAVYIATPHSEHKEQALLAIKAGKHVLVEKAFTRNAGEAEEVFAAARAAGVFVMEAMWTRFLPHVYALHQVHRRRGDRRDHQPHRRPRPGVHVRPEEPAVRPGAGRRRPAGPGRLPGLVRARLPRCARTPCRRSGS